jgi:hypothetical protein
MSGSNGRKPKNANKGSSSTSKYSSPFFTYRLPNMNYNDKELNYSPKSYEIGKINPQVLKMLNTKS